MEQPSFSRLSCLTLYVPQCRRRRVASELTRLYARTLQKNRKPGKDEL